jgi:hypothetical protein
MNIAYIEPLLEVNLWCFIPGRSTKNACKKFRLVTVLSHQRLIPSLPQSSYGGGYGLVNKVPD